MVIRIQDGQYELRYDLQDTGDFTITELKEGLPQRVEPNIPPWTAFENLARATSERLTFRLEELAGEDGTAKLPRDST